MNIVDRYQDAKAKEFKIDTSLNDGWGAYTLINESSGEVLMTGTLADRRDTLTVDGSYISSGTIRATNYPRDVRIEGRPFRIRIDDNAVVVEGNSAIIEFLD